MQTYQLNRRQFVQLSSVAMGATVLGGNFSSTLHAASTTASQPFVPIKIPDWVRSVTRMAFVMPEEIDRAAELGAQVCHGNVVWPYFPLRRDGGGLKDSDHDLLQQTVDRCHRQDMKYVLGLPPFPSVSCMTAHPDWRLHSQDSNDVLKIEPREDQLGTRVGCNNGPWGDYLIDLCVELLQDFALDGYSFDGNYHAPICYCPACKTAYQADTGRNIPAQANLDDVAYREYLVWRGQRLEMHYAKLQQRLKAANPDAVIMTWTVNAGRYGHFLHSPRAMPTRMNLLFDLPMQEWWQDETNFGASVAPAFGAAYIRAVAGDRPAASEAYLMSRGNPYGTDSFPVHERLMRNLHAMTNGCVCAEALGWPGHRESAVAAFDVVKHRESFLTDTRPLPWAALLVSEQTRQFYAYRDISDRFLPHIFGTFRVAMEEHFPLTLINDWDVTREQDGISHTPLSAFKVLILPGAAALSDVQCDAIREFVREGGGLVATGESSLCDELGRPRKDFALADLFGASYRGRPAAYAEREELDANFAITVDESYWQQRVGVATLMWNEAALFEDARVRELVPTRSVTFKGPQVVVQRHDGSADSEVIARMVPAGWKQSPIPAVVARSFGAGRVVYLPACLDAALWSYAYPYQRRVLSRLIAWAAGSSAPAITIDAPMCVQTTFWQQRSDQAGERLVLHFFNGLNTTANHGLPAVDVPLREETVPIHGIKVQLQPHNTRKAMIQPGNLPVNVSDDGRVLELPPLDLHYMLILE